MSVASTVTILSLQPGDVPALPDIGSELTVENHRGVMALFASLDQRITSNRESRYLLGRSRNCTFEGYVSVILNATKAEELRFISGQYATSKFKGDVELLITHLSGKSLLETRRAVGNVLEWCKVNDRALCKILRDGSFPKSVEDAFATATALSLPNEARWSDDGDVLVYLICALRQIEKILHFAANNGLQIIYVLEQPKGGGAVTVEQERAFKDRRYQLVLQRYGREIGPEGCETEGCSRLRIVSSSMCLAHHYEATQAEVWEFDDPWIASH